MSTIARCPGCGREYHASWANRHYPQCPYCTEGIREARIDRGRLVEDDPFVLGRAAALDFPISATPDADVDPPVGGGGGFGGGGASGSFDTDPSPPSSDSCGSSGGGDS